MRTDPATFCPFWSANIPGHITWAVHFWALFIHLRHHVSLSSGNTKLHSNLSNFCCPWIQVGYGFFFARQLNSLYQDDIDIPFLSLCLSNCTVFCRNGYTKRQAFPQSGRGITLGFLSPTGVTRFRRGNDVIDPGLMYCVMFTFSLLGCYSLACTLLAVSGNSNVVAKVQLAVRSPV